METDHAPAWPFYIKDLEQLASEISRLGLDLQLQEDVGPLFAERAMGRKLVSNRWCAQPLSGNDALPDGSPSPLTRRRYVRCAEGGFGIIWMESTDAASHRDPRSRRLRLSVRQLDAFSDLVQAVRRAARHVLLILQLDHPMRIVPGLAHPGSSDSGGRRGASDGDISKARDDIISVAGLAARAGFDGIDIQCCRGSLPEQLLTARRRGGKYGGSFANRIRFLREVLQGIRNLNPDLLRAVRLNAFHARSDPPGFGVDPSDYRKPDTDEPVRLARALLEDGLDLLNVTANSPNLRASPAERPTRPFSDFEIGDEHPLSGLSRSIFISRSLLHAAPGLAVVSGGWTWLRHFIPQAAAAAIANGSADIIGLGRPALAYPDIPAVTCKTGSPDAQKCCRICAACASLSLDGAEVGCVLNDSNTYAAAHRRARRFSRETLRSEALRCRECEPAPCSAAVPGEVDIPAIIEAFKHDRRRDAFAIIRRGNILPEMSAALAPPRHAGEHDCIKNILSGKPVPVRDIMLSVCGAARETGRTGVRIPQDGPSDRRIAVVGGGPAGVSAAALLSEFGHRVTILERHARLGGVPEILIPRSRFSGAADEIDALLAPAVKHGRIETRLGAEFGESGMTLDSLLETFDAVLLAAGLWQEQTLGKARGILDAPGFLEEAKAGRNELRLDSVAILAGGDCAMDSAAVARELGARDIYIVFPGPRSDMHWCMDESFFTETGVHAMMLTRPLGYETDGLGAVNALAVCPVVRAANGSWRDLPASRYRIHVDSVIEAAGLMSEDSLRAALHGLSLEQDGRVSVRSETSFQTSRERVYAAGALVNGGASVFQCVAEGMRAAAEIHSALGAAAR